MSQYFRVFDLQAASGNFTGVLTANAGITANTSPITANAGITANTSPITANAGITVTAGASSFNARPTVAGVEVALITDTDGAGESNGATGDIKAWVNFNGLPANEITKTGTAVRVSGSETVTITITDHGLITNNVVYLNFGSIITSGNYIVTFVDSSTFTIQTIGGTTAASAITTTFKTLSIRDSVNIHNVIRTTSSTVGKYIVNFITPMFNDKYVFTTAGAASTNFDNVAGNVLVNGRPFNQYAIFVNTVRSDSANLDLEFVMLMVTDQTPPSGGGPDVTCKIASNGTLQAGSKGVSSVSKIGIGQYQINLSSNLPEGAKIITTCFGDNAYNFSSKVRVINTTYIVITAGFEDGDTRFQDQGTFACIFY